MMSFRCMHLSLVFGSVVADSYYKTITPLKNALLCLELAGSKQANGEMLSLLECNGKDDQIWVFDNFQIRYGADEKFCVDAADMTIDNQLTLWECNGLQQQAWDYDADASTIFIANSSFCLDFGLAPDNVTVTSEKFHGSDCNGLDSQKWSIWDSPDPAGAPAPAPAPSPAPAAPLGSVVADSWYKTITPFKNAGLCLDLWGSEQANGKTVSLLECNGKDNQIWVFDNSQIRYGADENFCVDAQDMTIDTKLTLWECNGSAQQAWGWDAEASTMFIANSSFCLDFWEAPDNGTVTSEPLTGADCNGLDTQKWNILDSADPAGSPAPAPASSPAPAALFAFVV